MNSNALFQFSLKVLFVLTILFFVVYYLTFFWPYEFNFSDSIYVVVAMHKSGDVLILPGNDYKNGKLLYKPMAVYIKINKCKVETRKDGKTDCTIKFRESFFKSGSYNPENVIILLPNNGELENMLNYWQEERVRAHLKDKGMLDDTIDKIKTILDLNSKNK